MRAALSLALLLAITCGTESPRTDTGTETTATNAAPPPQPPPSSDEARQIVANSPEFSEYQFTNAAYTLPMQQSAMTTPARQVARDLRKSGWISITGDGTVVLTEKAKNDKSFLVRPNGVVDIVPLARKEVVAVEAVRIGEDGAPLVDFRWEWVPNEIGELFRPRYSGEQYAIATLIWEGGRWAVLRITPRVQD